MNDRFFIDTNIFIYSFDDTQPEKQDLSKRIIGFALENDAGIISSQVVQEFLNVATRKFKTPLSITDCLTFLNRIMEPLCVVFANMDLYHHSLDIMQRWKLSFYDSLIISAAIQEDCSILYSEDFQHNQKIQSLTIINPFIEQPSL
jgi:predicted nucleic acid-binding protein